MNTGTGWSLQSVDAADYRDGRLVYRTASDAIDVATVVMLVEDSEPGAPGMRRQRSHLLIRSH